VDREDREEVMSNPQQDPGGFVPIRSVLARRIKNGEYPAGAMLST
jgi:hypothetical protein